MCQWEASTKELCPWGQQGLGKISVPPVTPFLSGAGCAGTAPLILISKRREIPQRDELLILHPKEHPQKWKPTSSVSHLLFSAGVGPRRDLG